MPIMAYIDGDLVVAIFGFAQKVECGHRAWPPISALIESLLLTDAGFGELFRGWVWIGLLLLRRKQSGAVARR